MTRALLILAVLGQASIAAGEEAIDRAGRVQRGQLVHDKGAWLFRTGRGQQIEVSELSYIRFEPAADLQPTGPLTKTLLLPGGQRLTGAILRLDDQALEFANARTKSHVLRRDQVVGIVHAGDWLPIVYEDFEAPLKNWKITGPADLIAKSAFVGEQCLKLDQLDQVASRTWPPLTDGRISFVAGMSKKGPPSCWTIEFLAQPDWLGGPSLVLDGEGVRSSSARESFGTIDVSGAWHTLAIEWQAGILRAYVNDRCLGQTPMPARTSIAGIRLSTKKGGGKEAGLFIDELTVARRMSVRPIPKNDPALDSVWLEHGEQLFGRLVAVDAHAVTLDAKFGKRSIPWSRMRGIGFAEGKRGSSVPEAEVEFRPGPGCSADRLHVKLIRWDEAKLIVQHTTLGELAIERGRLENVRFEVK